MNKPDNTKAPDRYTQFYDMSSGGSQKEDWSRIYINASEEEAKVIFYNRFGHSPDRVTCNCCGEDYSITESLSLEQSTGYHRGCATDDDGQYIEKQSKSAWCEKYKTVSEYAKEKAVLIISHEEINDSDRIGEVPVEGYVYI